jgi:hypothetical protein
MRGRKYLKIYEVVLASGIEKASFLLESMRMRLGEYAPTFRNSKF